MPIYCIDDGGDGTQSNTTQTSSVLDWSKADTSIANLISYSPSAFTTSGNIIYFGHDHNEGNKVADFTLTGPSSGAPVILISADRTLSTPTERVGTGKQLNSTGGAYAFILDGSFALYSMRVTAGLDVYISPDTNEMAYLENVTLCPGANGSVRASSAGSYVEARNLNIDLTADSVVARATAVMILDGSTSQINGMTFVNAAYRTDVIIGNNGTYAAASISGADFSGFSNATACEPVAGGFVGRIEMSNCKAANYSTTSSNASVPGQELIFTNVAPVDDPSRLVHRNYTGAIYSTTAIYRSGGGEIEAEANSWLVLTKSNTTENHAYCTPWIYGVASDAGEKTFAIHITNDTADFTDAEVWIELQYLATSDSPLWSLASDHRATITTAPATQEDDTASTWVGTGPAFTYMQKLSVTATIGEAGQYRARVVVGKASIAGGSYFYIDPKLIVS